MPNFSGIWTADQQFQALGGSTWPSLPGAPTIGTATVTSNTAVSVTFTAPGYTGYPAGITGYIVTSSPGGLTGTGASSPISVTGLTTDTAYTFTVKAINATGTGPSSAASNSATPILPVYVEEVFSTYIYTGNDSTQTITNGIDLSTKSGLVWSKARDNSDSHWLVDTVRGANNNIETNAVSAQRTFTGVTGFTSSGYTLEEQSSIQLNDARFNYVSWTFRKQPKFFDIVTYTGNGTAGRTVAHNLGSAPGCIWVKAFSGAGADAEGWRVYHRSPGATKYAMIQSTNAFATASSVWNDTEPTSTNFTVGTDTGINGSGLTFVAYLFAHNAGGFGLTGTDNVVSCGSYTGTGADQSISLGFEPQWLLIKKSSGPGGTSDWAIFDNMRGATVLGTNDSFLKANGSNVEYNAEDFVEFYADGFKVDSAQSSINGSGDTHIYIAIRRGLMKVPTSGTSVFSPVAHSASSTYVVNAGFPTDMAIAHYRTPSSGNSGATSDRLRGSNVILQTFSTNADATVAGWADYNSSMSGLRVSGGASWAGGNSYIFWNFRRAPGFFDIVCYTGTGSTQTLTHNLGVAPELMIVKSRSAAVDWKVYQKDLGTLYGGGNPAWQYNLTLSSTGSTDFSVSRWSQDPTSTVFGVATNADTNGSSSTYVAYLFATCAGVSKVGSYTGTATTKQIDCGFTGGARFVLIKRTDSTGAWYVWDTARGIISGNDPYLLLNSTDAEVTNTDYIDTYSAGFELSSTAPAAINANGGTYIFLAIA